MAATTATAMVRSAESTTTTRIGHDDALAKSVYAERSLRSAAAATQRASAAGSLSPPLPRRGYGQRRCARAHSPTGGQNDWRPIGTQQHAAIETHDESRKRSNNVIMMSNSIECIQKTRSGATTTMTAAVTSARK